MFRVQAYERGRESIFYVSGNKRDFWPPFLKMEFSDSIF
jgi:hypothetical protein